MSTFTISSLLSSTPSLRHPSQLMPPPSTSLVNTPRKFTCFNKLPREIQLQIWEHAIFPRVLTLQHLRCFIPLKVPLVATLLACHDSRRVTLKQYKVWKFVNSDRYSKKVLWNPTMDTIRLHGESWVDDLCGLASLFPSETEEIESLAISTKQLPPEWGNRPNRLEVWRKFKTLRDLVVVVNHKFEENFAREAKDFHDSTGTSISDPWNIPGDVEKVLEQVEQMDKEVYWKRPKVRVFKNESAILTQESLQLHLRCFPCLGIDFDYTKPRNQTPPSDNEWLQYAAVMTDRRDGL